MYKTHITAHPIDTELQKHLGIYHSSQVSNQRVGMILRRLVESGHKNVHVEVKEDQEMILIHCNTRVE